jgi:gliding motility-associated-like protein
LNELAGNLKLAAMNRWLLIATFCLSFYYSREQACSNPGQTPQTAFPVCGTTTFNQSSVPLCSGRPVPGPCGSGLTDRNPYWYKFTCFRSGTLGFLISPLAANEDYDWQLFDVTGVANLGTVYTNPALFVTCSWSQYYGNTGATPAGTAAYACGSATPQFVRMPTITAGNEYLLMISHYTPGQSGYDLSFTGGTASITDTTQAHLAAAAATCDGIHINLKLNKRMRCSSLALNGSDFSINTASTTIASAAGFGCTGFDLDSLQLTMSSPLPAGNYRIKVKTGGDANTLLDACGSQMAIGDSVDVVVPAQLPIPMDSIRVSICSPQSIFLQFADFIRCSSIAPNGSDFTVTGPTGVTITSATATCNGAGLGKTIQVNLANLIQVGGTYTLRLQTGSDGNTLLSNCNQATPAGSALTFLVRDSVSTRFTQTVVYNPCASTDTVKFTHAGGSGISQWTWTFANGSPATATVQNPVITYSAPGTYQATLKVSNGFCTDSVSTPITIDALPKDTLKPRLAAAIAPCEGTRIYIKLNKKIKCGSIAANGSDFSIRPALAPITSAVGIGCGPAAETDSVMVSLGSVLPTGTYTLLMKNGVDGNTLLDNCNRTILLGDSIGNIAVVQHNLVTMDSIVKLGCKANELVLVFKEPVLCSSIAANGSDFTITGPVPVTITGATGTCSNGLTSSIKLTLANNITKGGTYQITLQSGTDANTLLNECLNAALPGGSLTFAAGDTVSAAFTYAVGHSCQDRDTLSFFHNGQNGVTQWRWQHDNGRSSTLQNPVILYTTYGTRPVSLMVTNGFCTDSLTQNIFIPTDTLQASFEASSFLCPSEVLKIVNKSRGNITNYNWGFGDGFTANGILPAAHTYAIPRTAQQDYNVKLTITGSLGCSKDTTVVVKTLNNCVIAVPTAFTPNGDGLNDYLYPTNAYKADKLYFKVMNRFGQTLFESRNMTQKWNGTVNGQPQPTGAYVWMLSYVDTDTGKPVFQKGTTVLIR